MLVCYFVSPSLIPAHRHSRGIHSSDPLHSDPLYPIAPLDSSPPESESNSESVSASAALFFSPSKSMPDFSHYLQYTLSPGLRADCSQRSIIGRVAIYCATMFCLLVMYFLIP